MSNSKKINNINKNSSNSSSQDLNNDESIEILGNFDIFDELNIFDFIKVHNYDIKFRNLFEDIWYPLFKGIDVLITNDILYFIEYGISQSGPKDTSDLKRIKNDLLEKCGLEYKKIKFDDPLASNYQRIKEEPDQKTWILISVKKFKTTIMKLNSDVADEIKDYYINIEELYNKYNKYIQDLENKHNEKKLVDKNNEIKKLNKENTVVQRKSLRLQNKSIKEKKIEKQQIVYISTSESYASQNRFKIGGVEIFDNLKSRLSNYNARSAEGDEWYYSHIREVANYQHFEKRFWSVFDGFRDKKSKEIIIMYYKDLISGFDLIVENYNNEIDDFNIKVETYVKNVDPIKPAYLIPDPYPLDKKNNNSVNKVTESCDLEDKIRRYFNKHISNDENKKCDNTYEIKRTDVISFLKVQKSKRIAWKIMQRVQQESFKNLKLIYFD